MKAARSPLSSLLGKKHPYPRRGKVRLSVEADVHTNYDAYGIPHITARSDHDLMLVLGYHHARDRNGVTRDPGFQGHGHAITNGAGRYRFRTIRPVPYPGRTPHIHIAVFPQGQRPLVTQLYIHNDPRNGADFLFNAVPEDRRDLVQADFIESTSPDVELEARFDLVLATTTETAV